MQNKQRILFPLAAAVSIAACTLVSTGPTVPSPVALATQMPSPTAAPTDTPASGPTSTAAPQGLSVSYGKLSLVIPEGLATGTTNSTTTEVEMPYVNPSNGDMPQHTKVILNGYPLQGTAFQPQIMVFAAAEYAQYTDLTQQIIATLQAVQYSPGQPLPEGLPHGPFSAQVAAVPFANGNGLRYITQIDQAVMPVNNQELIYYYQGLTDDGNYYVQAILPISAPFLPADANMDVPVPPGGVPFETDQLQSYYAAITDKLNNNPADQFSPPLGMLDALIQSLAIQP